MAKDLGKTDAVMNLDEKIVVIGAGPAGLTLAYELLKAGKKMSPFMKPIRRLVGFLKL